MFYLKSRIDEIKAIEIKEYYNIPNQVYKNKYQFFYYKGKNFEVNCYYSKNLFTIAYSSKEKDIIIDEADKFQLEYNITSSDEQIKYIDVNSQIGSDEVGVGDFFGPLIIASTYIENKDMKFINELKIKDSKKMNDDYILDIGPKIVRRIKNFVVSISAEKLSEYENIGMNKNNILSKCHNLSHNGIIKKYNLSNDIMIYVDQFLPLPNYKKYVGNDLVKNELFFRTSGESFFPSIAIASVIARYYLLQDFKRMSDYFKTNIPKGAGSEVDKTYAQLIKTYDKKIVDKYVKQYFANYKKKNNKI